MKKILTCLLFCFQIVVSQENQLDFGKKLIDEERFEEAEAYFEKILESNSTNLKAKEFLADIAALQEKWQIAAILYEELLTVNPKNSSFHFKYGAALAMWVQEMPKAKAVFYVADIKKHLLKAVQLNPKHLEARWALVELYLQLPFVMGGSSSTAKTYANELLAISPVDGYLARARIADHLNQEEDTEKFLIKALKIGQSPHTFQKLGDFYKNEKKDYQKAIEVYEEAFLKLQKLEYALEVAKISAKHQLELDKGLKYINLFLEGKAPNYAVQKEEAFAIKTHILELQKIK